MMGIEVPGTLRVLLVIGKQCYVSLKERRLGFSYMLPTSLLPNAAHSVTSMAHRG